MKTLKSHLTYIQVAFTIVLGDCRQVLHQLVDHTRCHDVALVVVEEDVLLASANALGASSDGDGVQSP